MAIAAGFAFSSLAAAVVGVGLLFPLQVVFETDLAFTVRGESYFYGELISTAATFVLVALALVGLWRFGADERRLCPECRSEVDPAATVCPMCTSEIGAA